MVMSRTLESNKRTVEAIATRALYCNDGALIVGDDGGVRCAVSV